MTRVRPSGDGTRLEELAGKLAKIRDKRFPDPGGDSDIQDVDEGLLEYKYRVDGYVSSILEGKVVHLWKFRRWRRLGKRISRLIQERPGSAHTLERYLEIYEGLEELINLAELARESEE